MVEGVGDLCITLQSTDLEELELYAKEGTDDFSVGVTLGSYGVPQPTSGKLQPL